MSSRHGRSLTVLVVEPDPAVLEAKLEALASAGCETTGVSTFEAAKEKLAGAAPDVLVTNIRLGAYNGLHLVVRSSVDHPDMGAVVLDSVHDKVLEAEAKRQGATYLAEPIQARDLAAAVAAAQPVSKRATVRRWPRKQVARGLAAQIGQTAATIVDVSYGGFRLSMPTQPSKGLSSSFRISIPEWNVTVNAEPVWMNDDEPSGEVWYGAMVSEAGPDQARAWRKLVDAVA